MARYKAGVSKLRGVIRNYDWGGTEFLSKLLSHPNPQGKPMAEYWLGAHDTDSAVVFTAGGEVTLSDLVAGNKQLVLGKTIANKFGRLPYLFKILDVTNMLSIQVHPAKHEAEIEFARENKQRVPLNAPHRNYKDDNHKPELAVALTDFWLLHGFKPVDKLTATLESTPELRGLLEIFNATGYDQLYKTVMEMPQQSVNQLLQPLFDRIYPLYSSGQLKKNEENFWALRAALIFDQKGKAGKQRSIDRGIFSIYFFNLLRLNKGEGLFQDAGVPHAYLEGQNVEIMANSDNVLRGGLTNKHIDVRELMKHIKFEETVPNIIVPEKINKFEQLYRTGAPDFRLSRFILKKDDVGTFESVSGEILFVVTGSVSISSEKDELSLTKGEAAFIISHQHVSLKCFADTEVYRASVPVHTSA
jgi:mannose-6-phosphate isomerase